MTDTKVTQLATAQSAGTNQRAIKATVVGVTKAADPAAQSKQLPEDPFKSLAANGQIIEPPFDMLTLALLPEHNSELGQCVEAMETNIEGFGHRLIPRIKELSKAPKPMLEGVKKERVGLVNFFSYASLDDSDPLRLRQGPRAHPHPGLSNEALQAG